MCSEGKGQGRAQSDVGSTQCCQDADRCRRHVRRLFHASSSPQHTQACSRLPRNALVTGFAIVQARC